MDKSQLVKVPIKYGITGGILCVMLFFVLQLGGSYPFVMSTYFMSGVIILIMLYFSTKELRDYKYGGKLAYWEGMSAGFVCILLVAFVSAVFVYVYVSQIDRNILEDHAEYVAATLIEDPAGWIERHGEEGYQKLLDESKQLISPIELAFDDFLKKMVIGFFITTIISLLFKRS